MALIIICFLIVLTFNLIGHQRDNRLMKGITKPILVPILIILYTTKASTIDSLVVIALVAGLLGDIFLMLSGKEIYFVLGAGSFLIGHVFYILAFFKRVDMFVHGAYWLWGVVPVYIIAGTLFKKLLADHTGKLTPHVAIYTFAIFTMSFMGIVAGVLWKTQTVILIAIGSILFIVSDAILGLNKFRDIGLPSGSVMLTYGLAQLLITIWFIL